MNETAKPKAIKMYCPRCDRPFVGTKKEVLEARISSHLDKAHPDSQNPFKEDD